MPLTANQIIAQCEATAAAQYEGDEQGRKDHLIELLMTKLREFTFISAPMPTGLTGAAGKTVTPSPVCPHCDSVFTPAETAERVSCQYLFGPHGFIGEVICPDCGDGFAIRTSEPPSGAEFPYAIYYESAFNRQELGA